MPARKFTDEQEDEIRRRYLGGENTPALSKEYGTTSCTLMQVLKRGGLRCRPQSESRKALTNGQTAELIRRYENGETSVVLGLAFGIDPRTVCRTLKRNGIAPREASGVKDSMRQALRDGGYFAAPRECEFYVYELAEHPTTHCKPGISFDMKGRISVASGKYGDCVLSLFFATRHEAFFLEQALLEATRDAQDCPPGMAGWEGVSEIRRMPAEDAARLATQLAEEMEELGAWEFAARYVPMTAEQRRACLRRAASKTTDDSL